MWGSLVGSPVFIILMILLGVMIFTLVLLAVLRINMRKRNAESSALRHIILRVTVPKEQLDDEEARKKIDEILAIPEAWWNTLGGMHAQRGMGATLGGRTDHFSVEIVALGGVISFYVVVPDFLRQFMEQQIHAQHPRAQIEEMADYNLFNPHSTIIGTTLVFRRPYMFPIKTYRVLAVDPLNAITNAMSKVAPEEGLAIQIVARSAKSSWHQKGVRIAREMQQGKKLNEAMGSQGAFGMVKMIFRTFFPKKKNPETDQPLYRLSPMEENIVKGLEEKTSKAGLDVNIRIIASAMSPERAQAYLKHVVDAFSEYTMYEYGNGFMRHDPMSKEGLIRDFIYRKFSERGKIVMNTEELASVFHFPLPTTETPNILWLSARKAPPPTSMPTEGLVLGRNVYRGVETVVRIKPEDRRRHVYVVGKSGVGKSVLLENMIVQDIHNGEGVCVVDPHGDLVNDILPQIPRGRAEDVVIFNPSDIERPIGLNMLEANSPEEQDFAIQEMIAIFYKLFPPEMIGPMFEHNMRNAMLTLMADKEYPGTIAEIPRMFTDPAFQKYKLSKVTDPVVRAFWEQEMAKTSDFHKSEMLGYLISKVGRFVENAMMRDIIGQPKSGFDVYDIMNNRKILLVNLSKGTTGEVNSNLLGLIIVSKLQMAALRRASLPQQERKDFYLYIDEFQNFVTDSIKTILSEARKYRLDLTIAHQYVSQLVQKDDVTIRDAVFGNVGTMVAFRVGVEDAEIMEKEFDPVFDQYDAMNVEMFTANVKLLIDNSVSKPFNMQTYPPQGGDPNVAKAIAEYSRVKYGRDKRIVEAEILERSQLGKSATVAKAQSVGERTL
ncbi:MAG: hypothetical protein UY52_C0022G0025 [Parcubacteria group bacterium GW2011_GWC2_49_9]|nr:MAG: hypothetical protein UY52_C0022G0025 [Parcubacteria group bacterium GW2011_GWC2_49_9]